MVGRKLPPERDMAARYGGSWHIAQSPCPLIDLGLLKSIQGSGNYIQTTENASSIYSFSALNYLSGGGLPRAQLLDYDTMTKPGHLPAFGDSHAHRFRRNAI